MKIIVVFIWTSHQLIVGSNESNSLSLKSVYASMYLVFHKIVKREESQTSFLVLCNSKSAFTALAPLEAVLFDVDGTLCDSDPIHHIAFREMLLEVYYFPTVRIC